MAEHKNSSSRGPMTPPAPPLDAPAVEAAEQWIPQYPMGTSHFARDRLARIITDAYEHRMGVARGDAKTVDRQHLEMSNVLARLRSERAVREELVKAGNNIIEDFLAFIGAVGKQLGSDMQFTLLKTRKHDAVAQMNHVIAEAKKLEKQDG